VSALWSYDAVAEFYDDDMGRNTDGRDVAYYRDACLAACTRCAGPVLEFGCGTGRITLALVQAGLDVVGIDRSLPMLRVLQQKLATLPAAERPASSPRLAVMDMAAPSFAAQFAVILCPFSAFTYLVEDDARAAVLEFVHRALRPGGRFLIDVFVPDARIEEAADAAEIFDYRRRLADGRWLERYKSIARNVQPGVNRISRRYRFLSAEGACERELATESLQRTYQMPELIELVRAAGLRILSASADFTGSPVGAGARVIVIEAEKAVG
jgi:SAM-dependent methyltransferase